MKHLHLVGLLLLSCTCPLLCAAQREAAALVRWKASLDGAADRSLGPWSMANSTSLCRWRYITCDSTGHPTELNLGGARLNGTLDAFDFSAFPHMEKLTLSRNDPDFFEKRIHIVWKNVNYAYSLHISAVAGIDLSGNSLSQEIPNGLTTLLGLRYLNLSGNHLSGCIPEDIGNLVLLESLDLSGNQLSGEIPPSLSALKSISVLNFSSNGLSGRIPTGSQLQVLDDPSIYSNNPGLCGFPLEDCISSLTPAQTETSLDEDREILWVYCFVAAGFIFGFWLYWGIFFRGKTWRCAFYQHVDNMQAKVTKKVYSCISRFQAGGSE